MPIQKNGFLLAQELVQNPSVFSSLVLFKDRMVTNCLMQFSCYAFRLDGLPARYSTTPGMHLQGENGLPQLKHGKVCNPPVSAFFPEMQVEYMYFLLIIGLRYGIAKATIRYNQ